MSRQCAGTAATRMLSARQHTRRGRVVCFTRKCGSPPEFKGLVSFWSQGRCTAYEPLAGLIETTKRQTAKVARFIGGQSGRCFSLKASTYPCVARFDFSERHCCGSAKRRTAFTPAFCQALQSSSAYNSDTDRVLLNLCQHAYFCGRSAAWSARHSGSAKQRFV